MRYEIIHNAKIETEREREREKETYCQDWWF